MTHKKYVLVTVLDWGLGHATRTIPVVEILKQEGFTPIIASAGGALKILRETFPKETFIELPPLRIHYNRYLPFAIQLLFLLPRMWKMYWHERKVLRKTLAEYPVACIVSDHRYGFYDAKTPSVLIIHQLQPVMPGRLQAFTPFVVKLHRLFLRKFTAIWVPDRAGFPNLSGLTGHPGSNIQNITYTGILSRMQPLQTGVTKINTSFELLIVLSGPEPHRSDLRMLLEKQLNSIRISTLMVMGEPEKGSEIIQDKQLKHLHRAGHLPADLLNQYMCGASKIIARCGYSTLMDLAAMQKQAALIPTPGQIEQEYLAKWLSENKICYCSTQSTFLLEEAISKQVNYQGFRDWPRESDLPRNKIKLFLDGYVN